MAAQPQVLTMDQEINRYLDEVAPGNRIELQLCDDCMVLNETGELPGALDGDDGQACEDGLDRLHESGHLFNDTYDPDDGLQFECGTCFTLFRKEDAVVVPAVFDEDGYEDEEERVLCTGCGGDHTSARDDGIDEFSCWSCDCCGSGLAGTRHRYALFKFIKETT